MGGQARGGTGGILAIIAAYALWLLTGVVAFGVCVTWQIALQRLYVALGLNKWGLAAFTYAVLIALIVGWLALVVAVEGWYRRGAEEGRLARRGAAMLGALAALTAAGLAVGRLV